MKMELSNILIDGGSSSIIMKRRPLDLTLGATLAGTVHPTNEKRSGGGGSAVCCCYGNSCQTPLFRNVADKGCNERKTCFEDRVIFKHVIS